ncbi:MAG: PTS system mannose/fructose/sorbose family transporter subunit IID, partial [Erysipelothrix sp.]|nr:PTS system mannose/fructose/sorbose family transporter subunit IID [Erysipelothrix sp.]
AYALIVSRLMFNTGYKLGKNSVVQLLQGSRVKTVTQSLGAVGMMVLGALVASNLNIVTPLSFQIGEVVTQIQPMLDSILPKFLNIVAFFSVYWTLKKGFKTNTIIILIFAAATVLSLLGIL